LVNDLNKKGIFVQIISNGTIDRLDEIKQANMVSLIVSLDGIESYHDQNRGEGNFAKSVELLRKADRLGFHIEVFSIVTKQNLPLIEQFEHDLQKQLNKKEKISITYHPRKPRAYLQKHPISNILGQTRGFDFLSLAEISQLMQDKQTFPPKDFGCYQISLMSNGKIYGCCEGINPIGDINSDIVELINKLKQRLDYFDNMKHSKGCLGCVEHEFKCGMN
jgi:MoaA/NifB/PqqE/SkfB family radical SAM enzyme